MNKIGTTIYNRIDENVQKTYLLMALFAGLITAMVWVFAQAWGVDTVGAMGIAGISLIVTGIINIISWYYSDSIALAVAHATEMSASDYPEIFSLVEGLTIGAGLPMPKIYLIDDSAPNAFATGRDEKHSAVAFTTGIIAKLNRRELEGVIAHELSHIKNRDTLYMTVIVILVGFIALASDVFSRSLWYGGSRKDDEKGSNGVFIIIGIIFAILAPLIAQLIKLAVSREREYLADASAALLTRYPDALADALLKLSADTEPLEVANKATAHMYIINPLKNWQGTLNNLFSTHPPIEERVKRLREM